MYLLYLILIKALLVFSIPVISSLGYKPLGLTKWYNIITQGL